MKTIISTILFTFIIALSFSQNRVSLKLIEKSDAPLSAVEHYYLFEVSNNSNKQINNAAISIKKVACNKKNIQESRLSKKSLKKDKITLLENITIKPNSVQEFYVKLNRSNNTKLNTWNCTKVFISSQGKGKKKGKNKLSNSITIETLIPNPADFR